MYQRPLRPDELMHFGIPGMERKKHNYIQKIKTSKGWRYIYDEATGKNYERSKKQHGNCKTKLLYGKAAD